MNMEIGTEAAQFNFCEKNILLFIALYAKD